MARAHICSGGISGYLERDGIEKTRNPEHSWSLNVICPNLELGDTLEQLNEPLGEVLLCWVCCSDPFRRKNIDFKRGTKDLHSVCDVQCTIKTLVKLIK